LINSNFNGQKEVLLEVFDKGLLGSDHLIGSHLASLEDGSSYLTKRFRKETLMNFGFQSTIGMVLMVAKSAFVLSLKLHQM
jgi:hypothetical protein